MGVPSFYRWLVNKYPNIRVKAIEEHIHGHCVDTSSLNPNSIEFDNLYLDMNGIIHPCFHPEDQSVIPPSTYEDVFTSIFEYIDTLFNIVRPRKLLYMAVDGVAPRAKMNQQRSRRFCTAKNDEIAEAEEDRLRREFELEGKLVLTKKDCEVCDPNVITPGTEFMYRLSKKLEGYIESRMNGDSIWKGIQVIVSDANVPGEGEHKIMSFIRYQRCLPGYDCNTRHCLYGLDADLIMLALATHEVHFSILREDVLFQEQQPAFRSFSTTSNREAEPYSSESLKHAPVAKRPYEFLHVWILREYIELDMKIADVPQNITFDLERIIDDFIFMCFFVGNDFLPRMPSLDIHEGAMDLLLTVYKQNFKNIGGYLVDMQRVNDKKGGYIKLKRVEKFSLLVGSFEEKIFKKRLELHERCLRRLCQNSDRQADEMEIFNLDPPMDVTKNSLADINDILRNTKELKEKLKENLRNKSDFLKNGTIRDQVRLGVAGWKKRYYKLKFSAETDRDIEITRKEIVQKYTEGLLWVLLYYFSDVPSWAWYYPYYYAPFPSDMKGLSQVSVKFQKGQPFKPFDQLMSVLPPRSAHALPKLYAKLITDADSQIIDFYPTDFEIDMDGKRHAWQGICKLPFIDEERLLSETLRLEKELMPEETERNAEKIDKLFVPRHLGSKILTLLPDNQKLHTEAELISGAVRGHVSSSPIMLLSFKIPIGKPHIPRPLEGVEYPEKAITEADIQKTQLWHEYLGTRPLYNRFELIQKPEMIFTHRTRHQIQGCHGTQGLTHAKWVVLVQAQTRLKPLQT
ncbi:5'-3' exoribonuclease 3 isoform X2 [Gossypium raimondii]|uniref:5'-3' exoribonuclease 3 isoform X2 n=1 Tax=Gossypium raimondii TaxID=29730 RepID=UPI00227C9A53|nr:5'-3' exoribonuclease 3 isoform X2 [Gossypium raimondii]